jgi:hypothetical protein
MKKMWFCIAVLLVASSAFGQLKVPAPKPDTTVTYEKQADGSIVRLQETVKMKDLSMLQEKRTAMDAQCKLFDGLSAMSPEQLQAAHALWEKYRDPIGKGVITVPQAIENMTAATRKEISAMDVVLKK